VYCTASQENSFPPLAASGKEEMMRIYFLAGLAGAAFATAIALPNRVDAMTLSIPSGVPSAAAAVDVVQPEQVRWCGRPECRGRYYSYYRTWPYSAYPYYYYRPSWGWEWPHCLQTALLRC
jgi:hypothetical protein